MGSRLLYFRNLIAPLWFAICTLAAAAPQGEVTGSQSPKPAAPVVEPTGQAVEEAVMVYGYPKGGSSLSITKGIVSRIEFAEYNFPVAGLRIQIDAAINPGNSGGPAVVGDKMIGLAFSHLSDSKNIGYIIPSEEIDLFLQDIADGHYDG